MRAREFRDVVEVLIIPSLERAVNELTDKRGSRRKARLLVQQSLDQLFGMMVVHKKPETVEERCRAAAAGARETPPTSEVALPTGTCDSVPGDPAKVETFDVGDQYVEHNFDHDQTTEGFGICRCGVVEDSEASALSCPGEDASEPADAADSQHDDR